jgi:hypothetical protein
MSKTTIDRLKKLAKQKPHNQNDDFSIYDDCAGNIDDAYALGFDDAEIYLAREILDAEGVEYEVD